MTRALSRLRRAGRWLRTYWRWVVIAAMLGFPALAVLMTSLLPPPLALIFGETALFVFLAALTAATLLILYQIAGVYVDRRRCPPLGRLLDLGGFKVHAHVVGEGSPTVIIDAGVNANMLDWGIVWPEVAKQTRVFLWDRAGHGWSEIGPQFRTSERIADELENALEQLGIAGPYVLVGQDFGALNLRLFAAQRPEDIAGMVWVTPLLEQVYDRLESLGGSLQEVKRDLAFSEMAARLGWLRVYRARLFRRLFPDISGLSPALRAAYLALVYLPKGYATSHQELETIRHSVAEFRAVAGRSPRVPTKVISRVDDPTDFFVRSGIPDYDRLRFDLCDLLAASTPDGEHVVVEPRDPFTPPALDHPRLVADMICDMVEIARDRALARSYAEEW